MRYINDFGQVIRVPIHFTSKEKFSEFILVKSDYDSALDTDITFPRFGFELQSVDYDPVRASNPMARMRDINEEKHIYMLNRVPYNFSFTLYLATTKVEDSLKIIEQIVPFFTPELNITIKDKADFGYATDIPIVLSNMSLSIDNQGSFETRRTVMWQLNFIAKGYLYSNTREQKRIKETIIKMEDSDFEKVYETLVSEIIPRDAEKTDSYSIIDKIYEGSPPISLSFDFCSGSNYFLEKSDGENFTILDFGEFAKMSSGCEMNIVEF